MKKILSLSILYATLLYSCTSPKKSNEEIPISALTIIKGQLNQLDTSLFQFTKLETTDGKTDTAYIKREEVRKLADDFLSLPDIAQSGYTDKYTEERLIDNMQHTLSITATAKNETLEIQKQIIIVPLDQYASGTVQSIYIDRYMETSEGSLQQKLFWEIDKYFQIASIYQPDNGPEKTLILKVFWE